MKRYKYNDKYFTQAQLVPILKKRYGKNWQDKMDLITKYEAQNTFTRECLRCSKGFETTSRFIRLCPMCHNSEDFKDAELSIL